MKSPGPANTDPSSTAGYPAALYNTVSGGGEGLRDQHPCYVLYYVDYMQVHGPPKTTRIEYTSIVIQYFQMMFRPDSTILLCVVSGAFSQWQLSGHLF